MEFFLFFKTEVNVKRVSYTRRETLAHGQLGHQTLEPCHDQKMNHPTLRATHGVDERRTDGEDADIREMKT